MEELQSTEILDREILEDARKKAHRILKTADDTIKTKAAEWERKTAATLGELGEKYAQSCRRAQEEILAVLPLEKRRARAKHTEELLNSAVQSWYDGLNRRRVLDFIQYELVKRVSVCESLHSANGNTGKLRVLIHNLNPDEAHAILKTAMPGILYDIEVIHSAEKYPELILETKEARIYASVGRAVEYIMSEKRTELVEILLGKEALADSADVAATETEHHG